MSECDNVYYSFSNIYIYIYERESYSYHLYSLAYIYKTFLFFYRSIN